MFSGSITKPVHWKLEVNHQWSVESEPKRSRRRPPTSLVYRLSSCVSNVSSYYVITGVFETQLVFCQSVRISTLLTFTLVRISSQRHLSRDEGLK